MATSFSAAVGAWSSKTKKRTEAVYRRSVELLGDEMALTKPVGGRVPFQTGNLARSLVASTSGMPSTSDKPAAGSNLGLVTAGLRLSQPVWIGYQAVYARRRNYGFVGADSMGRVFNEQGDYFVEAAIANWQQIVQQAVDQVKVGS